MRILLVGEYSRLHNSLKAGLIGLGHEVVLVSDGDGFKNFPADYSIAYKWFKTKLLNIPRQVIYRMFKYDIAKIENGLRFYRLLPKFKEFDVVQLINEAPLKTTPSLEKYLLKKLTAQNKKTFLLCCGIDYSTVNYMLGRKPRYSLMDPYFNDKSMIHEYRYILEYTTKPYKNLHDTLYSKINGVIASDMDYYLPLQNHPKFLGLVPNPVVLDNLEFKEPETEGKITIFLGINRGNYNQKGIPFFEKALEVIKQKYPERTEIIITENIPYAEYINIYNKAHILLDQVYGYDQGYNALEAMAKGKVVFTGAEKEFTEYYNLTERVAVNAMPDVDAIVKELSFLIENPDEITAMGKRARAFIEKEHEYITVAQKYLEKWDLY